MIELTNYGNIDIRAGVPTGWKHVVGLRLSPLCRKHDIPHYPALTGFVKKGGRYRAVIEGFVIPEADAETLSRLVAERTARAKTPEQKAAAKERRERRDIERFTAEIRAAFPLIPEEEAAQIASRACEIGSGRVGRSRTADDPVRAAVVAHIRHQHTDYDELLNEASEEIRHTYSGSPDFREDMHYALREARADARNKVAAHVWEIVSRWEREA